MADNDELVIKLRAEVTQLNEQLSAAGEKINEFTAKSTDSFKGLGVMIAQVFAAEKIASFFKEGVKEFSEFEYSMQTLGKKIEQTGTKFSGVKEELQQYIEAQMKATRFSDDEMVASLDSLMMKTKDYGIALKLNQQAMDLAAYSHTSLESATTKLGLVYMNNQRGMAQLARQFGITGEAAKNAQMMMDLVHQQTKDYANTEQNLSKSMAIVNNQVSDAGKLFGEKLAPAVKYVADFIGNNLQPALKNIIRYVETVGVFWGTVFVEMADYIELLIGNVKAVGTALLNWRHPIEAAKKAFSTIADNTKKFADKTVENYKNAKDEVIAIWTEEAGKKKGIDLKSLEERIETKKKETKEDKDQMKSEYDYFVELNQKQSRTAMAIFHKLSGEHKKLVKGKEESESMFTQRFKEEQDKIKEEAKATYDAIQALSSGVATTISGAFAEMVKKGKEGSLTLVGAFEMLGRAMVKFTVKAIGETLIQEGSAYIAKAIAAMVSVVGAAAAPGLFAAGASLTAAGGTMVGAAEAYLAEGGIVNKPTLAMLGEGNKQEAVIPLEKGIKWLGNVTHKGNINVSLPNVKKPGDINSAATLRTLDRQIMQSLGNAYQRTGQKGRNS